MNHRDRILILKTSNDHVFRQLLDYCGQMDCGIDCLIQSSAYDRFRNQYPACCFIDIHQEGFYGIEESVLEPLYSKYYAGIYIPTTGVNAIGFGNIIRLVSRFRFSGLVFFHSRDSIHEIKSINRLKEQLIRFYIGFLDKRLSRAET